MNLHGERIKIFRKYAEQMEISSSNAIYSGDDIPDNAVKNAIESYAYDADKSTVIGLIDLSFSNNGKSSILFTDEKLYSDKLLGKSKRIYYSDILEIFWDGSVNKFLTMDGWRRLLFTKENADVLDAFIREINDFNEEEALKNTENLSDDSDYIDIINACKKLKDDNRECEELLNLIEGNSDEDVYYHARHQNPVMLLRTEEYFQKIRNPVNDSHKYYFGEKIPKKLLEKIVLNIDRRIDTDTVIAVIDTTLFGNGKVGYIFTNDKMYSRAPMFKTESIGYLDIKKIDISAKGKDDLNKILYITSTTGEIMSLINYGIPKTPLKKFLEELISVAEQSK